jgi:hypothetical protein
MLTTSSDTLQIQANKIALMADDERERMWNEGVSA